MAIGSVAVGLRYFTEGLALGPLYRLKRPPRLLDRSPGADRKASNIGFLPVGRDFRFGCHAALSQILSRQGFVALNGPQPTRKHSRLQHHEWKRGGSSNGSAGVSWLVSDGSFRVHAINAVGRRKGRIIEVEVVETGERFHDSARRLSDWCTRSRRSSGELDQVPAWTPDRPLEA